MITKEDLDRHLRELARTISPQDEKGMNRIVLEHLRFASENSDNLAPDAQETVDLMFSRLQQRAAEIIKGLPDSQRTRELKRLYARSVDEHQRASDLIDMPAGQPLKRQEDTSNFSDLFVTALQRIMDLMYDIRQNTLKGYASYGQLTLLCMCVNELAVTFHLAQHRYVNQAYTHIRTVFEHLDKVELFRVKSEWAEFWCTKDSRAVWKELKPANIRKKLGKPTHSPLYSFFSSLGPHGTYEAIQATSAQCVKPSEKGNPQLVFWFGGTPIEHQNVWLRPYAVFAVHAVLAQTMKSFQQFLDKGECREMLRNSADGVRGYMASTFLPWAKDNGMDTGELEATLSTLLGPRSPEEGTDNRSNDA